MQAIQKSLRWMFTAPEPPTTWWRIILWWEFRCLIYNAIVGFTAVTALLVFFWAITTSGELRGGEDAVEPLALLFAIFAAPIAINCLYTLEWLVELPLRALHPPLSKSFAPLLFITGLGFSMTVVSLPAIFWLFIRLVQLIFR